MPENIVENKNIIWIDIAKFIGIFLVVFGHSLQTFELTETSKFFKYLWEFIYLFHMPLFFIIAGYLYKTKSKSDNYKKIIWGLLIPYLIYQFLFLPLRLGNLLILHGLPLIDILPKGLFGIIIGDFYDTNYSLSICGPCWFIMTIIQLRLLFNNIKLNTKNLVIISLLAMIILKFLLIYNQDLYFCLDNTLMAIPYFSLGYILKTLNFSHIQIGRGWVMYSLISTFIAILAICFFLNTILNYNGLIQMNLYINENIQNKSLLLNYLGGIFGTFMIIMFSKIFVKENKFVKIIAQNTLFIIFFHWLLLFFTRWLKIQSIIPNLTNISYKFLFIIFFAYLLLIISYYSIKLLEKYCPIVLGKYQPKGELIKC